ncbi:IS30 family transposase [Mycoplasma sp. VS410B]|uniref:IS30 family transposase n=1 Tax=Mycoplasma sp. VS410B TaxID=3401688 RepID=UPI003AAD4711
MQRKYKRLSRKERENIEALYFTTHHSIRDIAKIINRNPSTISRELKRNTVNNEYESQKSFLISMHRYHFKRSFPWMDEKYSKFLKHFRAEYFKSVMSIEATWHKVKNKWDCFMPSISTIYRWIDYYQWKPDWLKKPRYKAKNSKRKPGIHRLTHNKYTFPIALRPHKINDRSEFGHWEIDLVIGKKAGIHDHLLTLVERQTRLLKIIKVHGKDPFEINKKLSKLITIMESEGMYVYSITADNGLEFEKLQFVAKRKGFQIYKAQPYCSFQRGTNENANGLIRRRYKKGTNFDNVNEKSLQKLENEINSKPRKIFEWKSALDMFEKLKKERKKALSSLRKIK